MTKNSKVKIGHQFHRVDNFVFQHYLDENDEAFIADEKGNIIFKFDISARMFNAKGTPVGMIKLKNLQSETWAFHTIDLKENGKTFTSVESFQLKAKYPFEAEPEIIKRLVSEDKLQDFMEK